MEGCLKKLIRRFTRNRNLSDSLSLDKLDLFPNGSSVRHNWCTVELVKVVWIIPIAVWCMELWFLVLVKYAPAICYNPVIIYSGTNLSPPPFDPLHVHSHLETCFFLNSSHWRISFFHTLYWRIRCLSSNFLQNRDIEGWFKMLSWSSGSPGTCIRLTNRLVLLKTDKVRSRKCTVFQSHPWDPKDQKKHGIVLWVPETIEELIKTAAQQLDIPSGSCILSEDAGKILDVDLISDGQKLYLISQTH